MSDFSRLEDKLTKLRQRERVAGEGRRLSGGTAEALLAALVTEVDETILPRRLSFSVDGGATVHLAVANRRLQALMSPAPDLGALDSESLAGVPLADEDAAEVARLREVLLAAFASGHPVSIQSQRPEGPGYGSDVGVPASILARVWSVAAEDSDEIGPEEVLARFLSELGDDAIGWLRIEGEDVTDQSGTPEVLDSLGEQAALFLDGYFGKFETLFPDEPMASATVIASASGEGQAVLFVDIGGLSAFVLAKADRAPELGVRWQRLAAT